MLLMMGGNIARNMLSWHGTIIYIVVSCWLFLQLYHDARIHEHQVGKKKKKKSHPLQVMHRLELSP
jgi:hypothetical protein